VRLFFHLNRANRLQSIKLAKIDCTENAELCQQHGIQGYPTLKVLSHNLLSLIVRSSEEKNHLPIKVHAKLMQSYHT
jgi:protein-disulfide isomerase-like protein with CxxC motif